MPEAIFADENTTDDLVILERQFCDDVYCPVDFFSRLHRVLEDYQDIDIRARFGIASRLQPEEDGV